MPAGLGVLEGSLSMLNRYYVRGREKEGNPAVILEGPFPSEAKARDAALDCRNRGCIDVQVEHKRTRPRGSGARK
jgi:hypothetical protein